MSKGRIVTIEDLEEVIREVIKSYEVEHLSKLDLIKLLSERIFRAL